MLFLRKTTILSCKGILSTILILGLLLSTAGIAQEKSAIEKSSTRAPSMIRGDKVSTVKQWKVNPLFTVGESIYEYRPPGLMEGIGAVQLNEGMVRVYVNHKLNAGNGYAYRLENGTALTGARISYFDLSSDPREIYGAGLAYRMVVDRYGREVIDPRQINENNLIGLKDGFDRLSSGAFFSGGQFGLENNIYFTGEASANGQAFALDIDQGILYAVPQLGRAAFKNITMLDSYSNEEIVPILIGDAREAAPLYLYIGYKNALRNGSFLDRNGLSRGELHVWVADNGSNSSEHFRGTGQSLSGRFVKIDHFVPEFAGRSGYDQLGYADQATLDNLTREVNGFWFSRLRDLAVNPLDGLQAVLASSGGNPGFPSNNWGNTYRVDVGFDFQGQAVATLEILYDGDDGGRGLYTHPDYGLRNPSNLDWASDGMIYIQEARAVNPAYFFGQLSRIEASVWKLDPVSGKLERIAEMERAAVPRGQIDALPADFGNWASAGVLDVSPLFGQESGQEGETILIAAIQAHSLRGQALGGFNQPGDLVEGGQLTLLSADRVVPINELPGQLVDGFQVEQNYPNPFNPTTTIRYTLPIAVDVQVIVYNMLGQKVKTLVSARQPAGVHQVTWDATDALNRKVSSGMYIYRISAGKQSATYKMILMK